MTIITGAPNLKPGDSMLKIAFATIGARLVDPYADGYKTMVLKPNLKREKFTVVGTKDGFVSGFGDSAMPLTESEIRDTEHEITTPLMFTGIHILEPAVFEYIPRDVYSDIVPTFYNPALAKGERIAAHVTDANWFELSTIPRYLDISLAIMGERNVWIGERTDISPSAAVRDCVLWDDIVIGEEASLYRTIITDGVKIEKGEHFENAAIVRAEMVRPFPQGHLTLKQGPYPICRRF